MTQLPFSQYVEQTLDRLLERMCENDFLADLDADFIDGVLRVNFENGGVLILNRQEAAQQLWMASPEGPAHFSIDANTGKWQNTRNGESLEKSLNRVFSMAVNAVIVIGELE